MVSGGVVVGAVAAAAAAAAEVVVFLLLLEAPLGQLRLGRRVRLVAVQLEEFAEVIALRKDSELVHDIRNFSQGRVIFRFRAI